MSFKHEDRCWFRLTADEPQTSEADPLDHMSSTASCIEYLADSPNLDTKSEYFQRLVKGFAEEALKAEDVQWESEGAARIYCRVRTLPAILRFAPQSVLEEKQDRIASLIKHVWDRVDLSRADRHGISEAPYSANPSADGETAGAYPPNAFHTYWGLRTLDEYSQRGLPALSEEILGKRSVAELWAERSLAWQTSLIRADGERVDGQQLAWTMSIQFLQPPDPPLTRASAHMEMYGAALEAFFKEQLPSGTWPLYQPLFHYPEAGNAYAYTYETLTELLRPALHPVGGRLVRELLSTHLERLIDAWHFARDTTIPLGAGRVGWCSGHHPHRVDAEVWATAATFSFLQSLRRLVGFWTSELASDALGVRAAKYETPHAALEELRKRGDTWTKKGEWTVGRQLSTLFLHPVRELLAPPVILEPDRALFDDDQARSAILYGPPGTGKTSLVEALAGAIGWRFVEIHASDFLKEGMDKVPQRAEEIFVQLMELDHCVVLFDEIDELLRGRQEDKSDPFGRFLTTSMLPKLAKLWDQRRVLFFVATNDIEQADPAIKRSQRFDALVFVPPPSFFVKEGKLRDQLGMEIPGLSWQQVSEALDGKEMSNDPWGVFALLRYDQLEELDQRARELAGTDTLTQVHLREALAQMGRRLLESDWHHPDYKDPYKLYWHFHGEERRDYRMKRLVVIDKQPTTLPTGFSLEDGATGKRTTLRIDGALDVAALVLNTGEWKLEGSDWSATDDGLLRFKISPKAP